MNKFAVVSETVPEICETLKRFGYKLICTDCVDEFISYEKKHADMQCLTIKSNVFVLSQCRTLGEKISKTGADVIYTYQKARGKYPYNILLNTQIVGNNVIGKIEKLDTKVVDYLKKEGYRFINVNQGYAACSCLKVNDNSIITADNSIYNALANSEIDTLKISDGNIILDGAESTQGFIGGASVSLDNNNILFFGNIENHQDYSKIMDFCKSKNVTIHYIKNIPLTDIGGATLLKT